MNQLLETQLDCAALAIRLRCKRTAIDMLRAALATANRTAKHCVPAIMRALSYARRLP